MLQHPNGKVLTRSSAASFREIINVSVPPCEFTVFGPFACEIPNSVSLIMFCNFSSIFFSLCIFSIPSVAMAIMGGYLGLYLIFTIKGAITKKPIKGEPAITPAMIAGDASAGEGMPAVDSPEFDSFIASDRFTKMLESDDFGNTA